LNLLQQRCQVKKKTIQDLLNKEEKLSTLMKTPSMTLRRRKKMKTFLKFPKHRLNNLEATLREKLAMLKEN